MSRTRKIFVSERKSPEATAYFSEICGKCSRMKARTNDLMLLVRSAVSKNPDERTPDETEALEILERGLNYANDKIVEKARRTGTEAKTRPFPTADRQTYRYEDWDSTFKANDDETYRSLPAQVAQNAIRSTCEAWKNHFARLKARKGTTGLPAETIPPPSFDPETESTAWFSNQSATIAERDGRFFMRFPKTSVEVEVGRLDGKFVKAEVKPKNEGYELLVTTDDGTTAPEIPESPKRIVGIDFGVDNLMAVANNYGATPYVVKGLALKSMNQWRDKRAGELRSNLKDGEKSRKLTALERSRENKIRDFFGKTAKFVCERAAADGVEAIVIGRNKGWKQNLNMGRVNNRTFHMIPYSKLESALRNAAEKVGIPVIAVEESYTSKASLLDVDELPTYGEESEVVPKFSGTRTKRGLYRTSDGTEINADVNGAGNIVRKAFPNAFDKVADMSYLWKTTESFGYADFYPTRPKGTKAKKTT